MTNITYDEYMKNLQDQECKSTIDQYEVHITVEIDSIFESDKIVKFKEVCKYLDIKPLCIRNFTNVDGQIIWVPDFITSSTMECFRYPTVYRYMQDIAIELELAGLKVIRRKIECHPKNPRVKYCWQNNNCYFESHIKIKDIRSALSSGLPISVNDRQMFDDNAIDTEMVTIRKFNCKLEDFDHRVELNLQHLNYDMGPGGIEKEFCLYDDNVEHDNKWMNSNVRTYNT